MSDYNDTIEAAKDCANELILICEAGNRKAARTGMHFVLDEERVATMIASRFAALRRPDDAGDDGWRTIDDGAPKDGTPIWVCNRLYTENGFLPLAVRWRTYHPNAKGEACWRDVHGHKIENITHWRPLPAPPRQLNAVGR